MTWKTWLSLLCAAALLAGCGTEEAGGDLSDYEPPPVSGKADTVDLSMRAPVTYGEVRQDKVVAKGVLMCYPFESRDGATVSFALDGINKGKAFLYGPLDAQGFYGPPLQEAYAPEGGATVAADLVEDGQYLGCVVGLRRNDKFDVELTCEGECGVDEALHRIRANELDRNQLLAFDELTDAQVDALVAHRTEAGQFVGFAKIADAIDMELAAVESLFSLEWHRLHVSPEVNGGFGFADVNNKKTSPLFDPAGPAEWQEGSIVVPAVDMFERATTSIDLVMYSFSSWGDELAALENALARGVRVRAIMDISSGSPTPYNQKMIDHLVEVGVETRVPKYKTKTLHEKFAIVDGMHVFNGSANFSGKSSTVYAENRIFFQYSPVVVEQFQGEWDRLWDTLSVPSTTSGGEE